ncbi:L,D-transpeptidase family protein [Massilia sp. DD77]|uniref:L,D-transpeptidase family protein n=1 Tax=Massilia sp. DD77 TaxID=3109349 RepID=UPI002FFDFA40
MKNKHTAPLIIAALLGALPVTASAARDGAQAPDAQAAAPAQPATPAPATPSTPNAPAQATLAAPALEGTALAPQPQAKAPANAKQAQFERLLRAQVLLDRAHFSPGEIDGAYGSNMRQALNSFQAARKLPVTGKLDEATWNALNADNSPTLLTYTLVEADVAGPFRPVPEDMMAKASLPALGYASAVEGLGEKFHASPKLIERLNPGKSLASVGEQILVPNIVGKTALPKAAKVVVKDGPKVLQLFDAGGQLLAQYPASTGSEHDPLPVGTWKIEGVHPNPVYNYNPKLFWDAEPGDKKAKIAAGPNNPVGVAWIDLSKPHYGIHGTPVPAHVGKTESHGCIRLTNWSAAEVANLVAAGTEVVLQD